MKAHVWLTQKYGQCMLIKITRGSARKLEGDDGMVSTRSGMYLSLGQKPQKLICFKFMCALIVLIHVIDKLIQHRFGFDNLN